MKDEIRRLVLASLEAPAGTFVVVADPSSPGRFVQWIQLDAGLVQVEVRRPIEDHATAAAASLGYLEDVPNLAQELSCRDPERLVGFVMETIDVILGGLTAEAVDVTFQRGEPLEADEPAPDAEANAESSREAGPASSAICPEPALLCFRRPDGRTGWALARDLLTTCADWRRASMAPARYRPDLRSLSSYPWTISRRVRCCANSLIVIAVWRQQRPTSSRADHRQMMTLRQRRFCASCHLDESGGTECRTQWQRCSSYGAPPRHAGLESYRRSDSRRGSGLPSLRVSLRSGSLSKRLPAPEAPLGCAAAEQPVLSSRVYAERKSKLGTSPNGLCGCGGVPMIVPRRFGFVA